MQMHNDAAHRQREHNARVEDLEADIEQLTAQVARLRGAIRPFFLPSGSSTREVTGTAHCPLCGALTPATLKFSALRSDYVLAQLRPIKHHDSCIFAEEVTHG